MSDIHKVHWSRVVAAGFLSEAAVMVTFFLLLVIAMLAGVPGVARPMSSLDYVNAMLSSFAMVFLFTLWVGKRIESGFILHGALVGVVGILLFGIMWVTTTGGSLSQPPLYIVAHVLKILGGTTGGLVTERRRRRVFAQSESAHN